MRARLVVLGVVLMAVMAARAQAAPPPADPAVDAEAKRQYAEGTKAYNLGDFAKAVESFKAAYQTKPDPVYLYNIAQSYRLMKNWEQAQFFYKSFLRNMPDAPNKEEVDQRIKEMDDEIAKAKANPPPGDGDKDHAKIPGPDKVANGSKDGKDIQTPPAPGLVDNGGESKPIYKKWWFWTGIGAVAVGAVVVVVATSGNKTASPPSATFGNTAVF